MKTKIKLYGNRTALILLEAVAVVTGLFLLSAGFFLWRLTTGPLHIGFAQSYIERALHDPVSGTDVTLENAALEWPDVRGPLMMGADHVRLVRGGQIVLSVAQIRVGLSAGLLLTGHIEPVSVQLKSPALRLLRTEENGIHLSLNDDEESTAGEEEDQSNSFMALIDLLSQPAGVTDARSPLASLESLEIQDARVIVEDHVLGTTWYFPKLDMLFARDERGLAVTAGLPLPGGYDQAAHVQADVVYDRRSRDFHFNLHLQDFDPHIISRKVAALAVLNDHDLIFNGTIEGSLDHDLNLQDAAASLESRMGRLALDGIYKDFLVFDELLIDASYSLKDQLVRVRNLSLTTHDVTIKAGSEIKIAEDGKIEAPIVLAIDALPQERIAALWPEALKGYAIEDWLIHRLSKGVFKNIKANIDLRAEKSASGAWKTDVAGLGGSFSVEGMSVDYRHPLMPVTEAAGEGKIENDQLDIDIASGRLGNMTLEKGHVTITNLIAPVAGKVRVVANVSGPVNTIFRYIAEEPIGMGGDRLGFDAGKTEGAADLDVEVSFPAILDLKTDDVSVKVNGTLNDVLLPAIVRGMDLTGGPLSLSVAGDSAEIRGDALIGDTPITLIWKQYLSAAGKPFSSQLRAGLSANLALRERFGIGFEGWVDGDLPVQLVYTTPEKGPALVDADVDLSPAVLSLKPLGYEKPSGGKGGIHAQVVIEDGHVSEIRSLAAESPDLSLAGGRLIFSTEGGQAVLRRGQMQRFRLNETDVALDFEIGEGGQIKLSAAGPFFDARPFLDKGKDESSQDRQPPLIVSISADRMRTHPQHVVEKAKVYTSIDYLGRVTQLEMDALVGRGKIYLRLKPQPTGKLKLEMETDDAGAMLQAFNIYDNIRGGRLAVSGESNTISSKFLIVGHAEITKFNVVNAPVLAQLVSAISLTGITQLLGNEGIYFERLGAEFGWQIRPGGDLYTMRKGRTSGSSMGLTFEGTVDKLKNETDINGTIVPVSLLNEVISNIPIVGNILGGGRDSALFAATYSIKGPSEKPDVSVNPLSVFTPGILRKMFFEED